MQNNKNDHQPKAESTKLRKVLGKPNQNKPLVSIILPVFKSEEHLEACLRSLSEQAYSNIEIVAVVDYLGDQSLKILKKYKKIEPRLRVYANLQRYGLASTLNRALQLSKGQYIAFMDPIGIMLKSRIGKQVSYLIKNPKIGAVGTQITLLDHINKSSNNSAFPLEHEDIYKHLIGGISMKFETAMVAKTRLPKDILKFNKNTHYPYVFIDVFMKIGQYSQLANINNRLVLIRDISKDTRQLINVKKNLSFIKLLFESTTNYEYKPSLRSLISPILR